MNVLSLFDGMSCGQLALNRAGIKYDNYYASEIDKFAIKVTQHNFPNTIQLGDVTKVSNLEDIYLLIGGSPCQGFSFAGRQLNFDDLRSKLFFEYVRILKEYKPKYFLLENVMMKQEYQDVITEHLGVEPIKINSSLVSAQNRKRLYWTNIPNVTQPEDKCIFLKDIIEDEADVLCGAIRGRYVNGSAGETRQELEIRTDGKTNSLTTVSKDNNVVYQGAAKRNQKTKFGTYTQLNVRKDEKSNCVVGSYAKKLNGVYVHIGNADDIKGFDIIKRIYDRSGKAPSLTTSQGGHREPKVAVDRVYYRALTPVECERLQTVPDNYTSLVSNSQRYKMLGNGWTIDVIAHIFKGICLSS